MPTVHEIKVDEAAKAAETRARSARWREKWRTEDREHFAAASNLYNEIDIIDQVIAEREQALQRGETP